MKKRTTRIAPISAKREHDAAAYRNKAKHFLEQHPYCQYEIGRYGATEAEVIKAEGYALLKNSDGKERGRIKIARSVHVHHRNKRTGRRLLDERFWLAVSRHAHDIIEQNKSWARGAGYLLPIQADENGHWGKGNRGLTTDELLASQRR